MASVTLENVDKVYPDGFRAITDLNLEIEDGEFLVLVGPSGCGKSTALRMIAGLEEISAGTLSIGDQVVNDVEPKDRDIAMVFQNCSIGVGGQAVPCSKQAEGRDRRDDGLDQGAVAGVTGAEPTDERVQ